MRIKTIILAGAVSLGLAACGSNESEQFVLGGIAGASTAAAFDKSPVLGFFAGATANLSYCSLETSNCN